MKTNLLKTIEADFAGFSKGQKRIASYLLEHYDKAAYMTAAKLGRMTEVSESTVVRFADELGFDGYAGLQNALQELVRTQLTAFQRIEVSDSLIGDKNILEQVLLSDVDNLRRTLEQIDRDDFNIAVDKIASARRIYIFGARSSALLAGFMFNNLQMAFDNLVLVQTSLGSEMLEQIMHIGKGDVMIAISFPRYSRTVVKAVEFAAEQGADVIALTDSPQSPIAAKAGHFLRASSDMASFADSLVAPLSIINAITVSVAKKKRSEVTERLQTLEKIWDEYDVYDKHHD